MLLRHGLRTLEFQRIPAFIIGVGPFLLWELDRFEFVSWTVSIVGVGFLYDFGMNCSGCGGAQRPGGGEEVGMVLESLTALRISGSQR